GGEPGHVGGGIGGRLLRRAGALEQLGATEEPVSLTDGVGRGLAAPDAAASRFLAAGVPTQKFVVAPRAPLRPPRQARRRSRILEIRRGGATPTGGMQRRPNANELLGRDTSSGWRPGTASRAPGATPPCGSGGGGR